MRALIALFLSSLLTDAYAVCDKNADILVRAYPEHLVTCKDNYIIWRSGERQLYDDQKKKDVDQLLEHPDLEDMFTYSYPVGIHSFGAPAVNVDPGRIRNEAFFKRLYGSSAAEVNSHLTALRWMPKSSKQIIKIQRINGVAGKLEQISQELDGLPAELKKFVSNTSGTFNWRVISGTKLLSNHSFGIAIDINTKFSNYWQWSGKMQYKNAIPQKIVEIFEKHGFIWGGKWYHYDTMHFEYRPELLMK
ncbi:M15 family metallopeptidase [Methylovulum psychrotolerans]|uniref:M15 family metallopeptidase n=1 Tax=Methylovulum psychrotolerans TaxID=1704499 RepID=UPI0018DF5EB6|nr:M15 family metallopeptidase [Methylovulum psychrotolerans]